MDPEFDEDKYAIKPIKWRFYIDLTAVYRAIKAYLTGRGVTRKVTRRKPRVKEDS